MSKLTVVMPAYNQGQYIYETLASILGQTFRDWRLIIVDDGSTDRTEAIIDFFSEMDARITVVTKPNGGTGSALNAGFESATDSPSPYETWFASDNVLNPNAWQTLVDHLDAHSEIDFVYSNCDIGTMDATGTRVIGMKNILTEVKDQSWSRERFARYYFLGIFWMWRRELRLSAGGEYQLEPCEDYDMALRMMDAGGQFAHIPHNLGWFRRHTGNMSNRVRGTGAVGRVLTKHRERVPCRT